MHLSSREDKEVAFALVMAKGEKCLDKVVRSEQNEICTERHSTQCNKGQIRDVCFEHQ